MISIFSGFSDHLSWQVRLHVCVPLFVCCVSLCVPAACFCFCFWRTHHSSHALLHSLLNETNLRRARGEEPRLTPIFFVIFKHRQTTTTVKTHFVILSRSTKVAAEISSRPSEVNASRLHTDHGVLSCLPLCPYPTRSARAVNEVRSIVPSSSTRIRSRNLG